MQMNGVKIIKTAKRFAKKNASKILLGLGIGLGGYAVYKSVTATAEALDILDEELVKTEPGAVATPIQKIPERFTMKDKVRLTWKCYIPAAVASVASVTCLISAGVMDERRIGALTTAVSMSESALREYMAATVKTVGEKKERDIRDTIAKDKLEKSTYQENKVTFTGNGETLCYDALSGRYFRSCYDAIRRAENEVNKRIINGEDSLTLNDLYFAMGLDTIGLGDRIGWNVEDDIVSFVFSSQLAPSTGEPCLVIDHNKYPYPIY
jgi:hypothetical protein